VDVAVNAGLVAGSANLLNLFDLRPGRAIKVAVAGGGLLAAACPDARPAAAAPLGAALALLPEDLAERAMLGDAGANALGAMLGAAAAAALPRPARVAVLLVITGLTAASEVVSFTAVIARTPALNWADMLGRRPAGPAAAAAPPVTAPAGGEASQAGAAGTVPAARPADQDGHVHAAGNGSVRSRAAGNGSAVPGIPRPRRGPGAEPPTGPA
jgi:hypothetical protein